MKYGREVDEFFSLYETLTGCARSVRSIAALIDLQGDTGQAFLWHECCEDREAVIRAFAWRLADLGEAAPAPDVVDEDHEDFRPFDGALDDLKRELGRL
jgi:hypothetical protein